MDKELLRIVIIATGLLVIVGMITWAFIKGRRVRRGENGYGHGEILGKIDKSLILDTENDDFDIIPVNRDARNAGQEDSPDQYREHDLGTYSADSESPSVDDDVEPPQRFVAPEIIQFSIVAKNDLGFNGIDLANAFQVAGLEFGPLKIFERLDAQDDVLFRVANMVSPGTFPETGFESFFCPGIVCFMQPGEVEDAASVFEDYLETIELLAVELDGDLLDHNREPLNETTVKLIRQSL
jgi:cell division protein ZipA